MPDYFQTYLPETNKDPGIVFRLISSHGDEITLYRTVEVEEDKVIGVETITEKIVDYTILNNIEEFCYNHVVKVLSEVIPENKIEKLY